MLRRKAPGTSASKIAISQQGRCLLWRQGKQRAIQKPIPRPQLQHLVADHDKPSDFHYI
jgi:hypothetical protein